MNFIGSGGKIRPAKREDVHEADVWLKELLGTLQRLRIVVFVGQKARYAQRVVQVARPDVLPMTMPHPSPMFVNRAPGNRARVLADLQAVATRLAVLDNQS